MKIASWRLICKKDWSQLNYFSGVVGGNYSGSSQTVRWSCTCDSCRWISAAGCLFSSVNISLGCNPLKGDRSDPSAQRDPWAAGGGTWKPNTTWKVLRAPLATPVSSCQRLTFEFFCAVLARVIICDVGFWNLWEHESGEVAFCPFWFSVASENRLFTVSVLSAWACGRWSTLTWKSDTW